MLPQDVGYSDPATAHTAPGFARGPVTAPVPPGLSSTPDLWALLAALRPQAVALTEAFGYEQGHLRAAIATGAEQQRQDEARAAATA